MIKRNNFLSLQFLLAFLLVSTIVTVSTAKQTLNNKFASWFNFKKSKQYFTLSNPYNKLQIQFPIKQQDVKATSVSITKKGYWKSTFKTQYFEIKTIGKAENALFEVTSVTNNIQLQFNNLSNSQHQMIHLSTKGISTEFFVSFDNTCNEKKCKFQNQQKIFIFYHNSKDLHKQLQNFQSQRDSSDQNVVKSFVENLSLNSSDDKFTENIAKSMLTHSLSSMCIQKSQYQGFEFYGFCSNFNTKKIDLHYSPLAIDLLFSYNIELGVWLVENFIQLLKQKLFYSFSKQQWIPLPEHIEVFTTYLSHQKASSSVPPYTFESKVNDVIQLQNGLINSLLLSEVNHLSEEINYRQNNKIHPTLLKMLNQVWKTNTPRARVSSIYDQSFTNDFFYHQQNQKLESSVGKMVWIIKLIHQHIAIVRIYGNSYQKQSLEQLVSLSKVMNGFLLDDSKAKNGDFYSIIIAQNLRLYCKSVGYESLLPFAYSISPVFPINTLLNLTTSFGLASLPTTHHKVRQTYNFRGNINLYFNYKIMFNMIQRTQSNPKFKLYQNGIKTLIESLQQLIVKTFVENKKQGDFFTSWNPQSKGVTQEKYLAILNVAFLKTIHQENQQTKKTQYNTESLK